MVERTADDGELDRGDARHRCDVVALVDTIQDDVFDDDDDRPCVERWR